MVRWIARILLTLAALAVGGFVVLVLVGLWDRYEQNIAALDFNGTYTSKNAHGRRPLEAEPSQQAQSFQPARKLVGTGGIENANQGMSVAVSADGHTVILGGPGPNNVDRDRPPLVGPAGAAWVFTLRGGGWMEQGKLVGTTSQRGGGLWSQGASVALSADGKTAVVGGPSDDGGTGAAWVFTFGDQGWKQQGKKLVGSSPHKPAESILSLGEGVSVALSADGNTAIVGGWRSEGVWVFTRNGDAWTQQGKKLVGTGAVGNARQGMAVALSGDGGTAIVGGPADNSNIGAAWIFTRTGDVWRQQGNKLVGSSAAGRARQGTSVALSADGNTALLGGPDDASDRPRPFGVGHPGAAWVFTRTEGVWMQEGQKLASSAIPGNAREGTSVALSTDGNIAVLAGVANHGSIGAVTVFTRSAGQWTQDTDLAGNGAVVKAASSVGLSADGSVMVVGAADENGGIGAAWVVTRKRSGSDEHAEYIRCREASDERSRCNSWISLAGRDRRVVARFPSPGGSYLKIISDID
jgi:hypothetical protein